MQEGAPNPNSGSNDIPPIEQQVDSVFAPDDHLAMEQMDLAKAAVLAQAQIDQADAERHIDETLGEVQAQNTQAQHDLVHATNLAIHGELGSAVDDAILGSFPDTPEDGLVNGDDDAMTVLTKGVSSDGFRRGLGAPGEEEPGDDPKGAAS